MEGSRLTHDQTRYIFETNTIGVEKEVLNVDDVIETVNHFRCIDMISVNATGKVTSEGFVVFAGSTVNEKMSLKSLRSGMLKQRQKLLDSSKVEHLITTEDILFSSSSAAANFILGYSVSGPRTWKTKDGKSLKEIESNQT